MKVFLSWSDERSKKTAELFSEWLPQVIQAIEPWISNDIAKGARWSNEISLELEKSKIGIICLTPENLDNRWILFEAGALSKISESRVCTFLLDLTPSEIKPPLGQFHHTPFTKEDVLKLVRSINEQLPLANEKQLPDTTLLQVFERSWLEFEKRINEIKKMRSGEEKLHRSDRDILEEMLEILRRSNRQDNPSQNISDILPNNILERSEGKILRLVDEFGVTPYEAARSIINELGQQYPLSNDLRNRIFNHLIVFAKKRKEP
jgi:hypothetical protein